MELTEKQQKTLDEIESYKEEHGIAPSYEELCDLLGKSLGAIQWRLERLEAKGAISRESGKPRSITINR